MRARTIHLFIGKRSVAETSESWDHGMDTGSMQAGLPKSFHPQRRARRGRSGWQAPESEQGFRGTAVAVL